MLIKPSKCTRLGLVCYSPVKLSFENSPDFEDLGLDLQRFLGRLGLLHSDLNMKLTIPQCVMVSVYQQVKDEFGLMANFGWQNWSAFGNADVALQIDSDR